MEKKKSNKTGKKTKASAKRINPIDKKTTKNASSTGRKKTDELKKAARITVMPKRRTSARDILDERLDKHKLTTTTDNPIPSEKRNR
jgi:hypothetical protein